MWNSYWTFLDYLELRRRVEKRLLRSRWLFGHIAAFVTATIVIILDMGGRNINNYYIDPNAGYIMAFWSFLLAAHGVFAYLRSSAASKRRSQAIEEEMRERIRNDDTYISDNPKDLFRVHYFLERDLGQRSVFTILLTLYTIVNAVMWITWALFTDMRSAATWMASPGIALLLLLPMLAFSLSTGSRREQVLREEMESLTEMPQQPMPKQKRPERGQMRLTDDGELLTIEDKALDRPKSKRR